MNNLRGFYALITIFILAVAAAAQKPVQVQIADNRPIQPKPQTVETTTDPAKNALNSNLISNPILQRVGVQNSLTLPLTLNEAIRRALENNNTIEVSRTDVRYQETRLRSLLGVYDPVFTISPTYTRSSTTGSDSTGDFRANAGVTKFFKNGGSSEAFFNNTRSENAFTQSQLSSGSTTTTDAISGTSAIYSSNLGVNFTQPLFRNFKTDGNRRQIKIQRKTLQQSDADFRRQTIDIISQVQRAYWDLVFALRDQQNQLANLNLSKENLRQIQAKIDAGASAPLERAEVATELANREISVLTSAQQVTINENTLKNLMLKEATAPEWSESIVPTDAPVFSQDAINLDDAIKDAMENRPELKRLQFAKEINQINIDYYRNQVKPQIDLNTQISLNGLARGGGANNTDIVVPTFSGNADVLRTNLNTLLMRANLDQIPQGTTTIPASSSYLFGGFNRSFGNLFRTDAPNYSFGVTFSFPLRNKTAKANLAGERILQEQTDAQIRTQEQTVLVDVRNAVQAVETSRQQVLASRRARENAEIQLAGERDLFDVGRSTTFLLFQRENTLTNARNSEIRAETDYNKALSDLQRATSTTFRANGIEVDSPMNDK